MIRFVLLYLPVQGTREGELLKALEKAFADVSFAVLRDFVSVEKELTRGVNTPDLVLLFIRNRDELPQAAKLRQHLLQSSLILILPDQAPEVLSVAHTLRPRFVGYVDDDFALVAEVLVRLIREWDHKQVPISLDAGVAERETPEARLAFLPMRGEVNARG